MPIIPIENTKQLPPGKMWRAVQAENDDSAVRELAEIAKRIGAVIETIYKWGQGYYYAAVK